MADLRLSADFVSARAPARSARVHPVMPCHTWLRTSWNVCDWRTRPKNATDSHICWRLKVRKTSLVNAAEGMSSEQSR